MKRKKILPLRPPSAGLVISGFCTNPEVTRRNYYPASPEKARRNRQKQKWKEGKRREEREND